MPPSRRDGGLLQVLATLAASPSATFADLNDHLKAPVAALISENPSSRPGPETFTLGQGDWRVFHAPHITGLAKTFGACVDPLIYELDGKTFVSNARYTHPLLGRGWLSASGAVSQLYTTARCPYFSGALEIARRAACSCS